MSDLNWTDNNFPDGYDECYKHRELIDVEDFDCDNGLPSYTDVSIDLICKKCGNKKEAIPPVVCCDQDMVRPITISSKNLEKLVQLD